VEDVYFALDVQVLDQHLFPIADVKMLDGLGLQVLDVSGLQTLDGLGLQVLDVATFMCAGELVNCNG
jgi:hypothetical protein